MPRTKTDKKPKAGKLDASFKQIEGWASTICSHGDEAEAKTDAFLLLMDEIERAQFDRMRIDGIVYAARMGGFAGSDQCYQAQRGLVRDLRAKAGLSNDDRPNKMP